MRLVSEKWTLCFVQCGYNVQMDMMDLHRTWLDGLLLTTLRLLLLVSIMYYVLNKDNRKCTLDMAPLMRISGMARVVKGSQAFYLHTDAFIYE